MSQNRTVAQLESELRSGNEEEVLSGPALAGIRSRGRTRRRRRWASYAAGTTAVVLATGVAVGVTAQRDGDDARDDTRVAARPTTLSPLAKRALREIPGAVQVSDSNVLLPTPVGKDTSAFSDEKVPDEYVEAGPIDIGARRYSGVAAYEPGSFPAWLTRTDDPSVIADAGPLDLVCMRPLPQWGGDDSAGCNPAMLGQENGSRTYAWGMGADGFLDEGEDLQLFSSPVYSDGTARTVWIGGTDGTDVATVDLVATDGTVVTATVAAGTLVPDETMFWGTVSGDLAMAVTRDGDGDVLERHQVQACSDPVDCEVR